MKKRVAVLGATGSIGRSALDVIRNSKDLFEPALFTAHTDAEGLLKLKKEFPSALTALANADTPQKGEFDFLGRDGLLKAIAAAGADIALNGIAGAAGLEPSAAAIRAGSDLALANKETVIMAGRIIFEMAKEKKVNIIPVDSEHSALSRLIEAHGPDNTTELILTASGGPFRDHPKEKLTNIKPEEALAHPTWDMGRKITIDSATLANKGLEVIEAAGLFGFPPEKIRVVVHPQSIVHSMIRLRNGAVYAQMSKPDMRLPIHDALFWPETGHSPFGSLDFDSLTLTFEKPDYEKFPMLSLAYRALKGGPLLPVAYNAANEIAVDSFFNGKISFTEIPRIVSNVIDRFIDGFMDQITPNGNSAATIEAVLERDREARKMAVDSWRGLQT